jgi:hypothetical protein
LNLAVKHIPKILESCLLIPRIFAGFLFALNNLKSLEKLMLHLQDFFVALQILEPDIIVLLEQLFEYFLLLFVLPFKLVVLLSKPVIPCFQIFVDGLNLDYLFLLGANLLFNLSFILLFLFVELAGKIL